MSDQLNRSIDRNISKTRRRIELVEEFIKDIERIGGKVPPGLRKAVDRYHLAVKLGTDAAEAANEVSRELRAIYQDMYLICRTRAGITPGQPHTEEQASEYQICAARVDRQWQARNVKKVLDWDDDRSWVRKLWSKWWDRLLDAAGFGEAAKAKAHLRKQDPKPIVIR